MKKTLALALVAAMTISMASMTAFAKDVAYSDENADTWPEKTVATVSLTKDDMTKTKTITSYKAKEAISTTAVSKAEGDAVTLEEYAKLAENQSKCEPVESDAWTIKFSDLKLKTFENTMTKTFYGWAVGDDANPDGDYWKKDKDPKNKDKVVSDDKDFTFVAADFDANDELNTPLKFCTVGRTDTTEEGIAKNLKAIEDAKNGGDAAQKEKDRLAELDKKYNADGKNAYDKEKKDVEGEVTFTEKKKAADSMDDFYYHAAKVAGVSTDADKTWVYDITMKDGQKLYEGKNQRVTVELNGVNKDADLSKFGVKVYHVEGWCKATQIKNVDVKGNKVTFWTNSFSPYVITIGDGVASTGAADASNPSTGDFSAVPVALLAAAALGATGFVAYKKRKAE